MNDTRDQQSSPPLEQRGIGYAFIKSAAKDTERKVTDLLALAPQNDPFYQGAPSQARRGEWFAQLWEQFKFPRGVHLRRIHYRLISQREPVLMSNGLPYANTDGCWAELGQASKAARYLRLVPPGSFSDQRNPPPMIFRALGDDSPASIIVTSSGPYMEMPRRPGLPSIFVEGPSVEQPYVVEIWAEKSTMNDVLVPLCERRQANLVTGVGEMSITAVETLIERMQEYRRPVRVLYVSDFDPAGRSMPVAVARKAEFFIHERFDDEDELEPLLQLYPPVLTAEQCRDYDLPRTPIKDSERRKESFENNHGVGATELDALEALHTGELRRIVARAIDHFCDDTLAGRCNEQRSELSAAAAEIRERVLIEYETEVGATYKAFDAIVAELADWQERNRELWGRIGNDIRRDARSIEVGDMPEPFMADDYGVPLFCASRHYLDQIDAYRRFKDGGDGGER